MTLTGWQLLTKQQRMMIRVKIKNKKKNKRNQKERNLLIYNKHLRMRKKIRKLFQLQLNNQVLMLSKLLLVLFKLLHKLQRFQSQVFQSCNKINSNQLLNLRKKQLQNQNQKKKPNLHQRLLQQLLSRLQLQFQLNNLNQFLNHLKNLKSQLQLPPPLRQLLQPLLLLSKLKQKKKPLLIQSVLQHLTLKLFNQLNLPHQIVLVPTQLHLLLPLLHPTVKLFSSPEQPTLVNFYHHKFHSFYVWNCFIKVLCRKT